MLHVIIIFVLPTIRECSVVMCWVACVCLWCCKFRTPWLGGTQIHLQNGQVKLVYQGHWVKIKITGAKKASWVVWAVVHETWRVKHKHGLWDAQLEIAKYPLPTTIFLNKGQLCRTTFQMLSSPKLVFINVRGNFRLKLDRFCAVLRDVCSDLIDLIKLLRHY